MVDKRPERVAHIPQEILGVLLPGLARHCPKEYYNLAAILPGLFAQYKEGQD